MATKQKQKLCTITLKPKYLTYVLKQKLYIFMKIT